MSLDPRHPEPSSSPAPSLALGVLAAAVAGAAALGHCALLAALLKRTRTGLSSILIQLSIADIIFLGCVWGPELWSNMIGNWTFGYAGCIAFQGFDVFATTASIYLVATVALHSLATISYEEAAALRRRKRIHEEEEEIRSSRHSLVANSDSSTPPRTMHIDYRLSHARVRVAPPTIFVWILAVSLSIPEFSLSTTIAAENGQLDCSLIDFSHRVNIHLMLAIFHLLVPAVIYSVIIVLLILKVKSVKRVLDAQNELIATLKLSLCLIMVSGALSGPRPVAALYRVLAAPAPASSAQMDVLNITVSGLALVATLVRPVLCIALLPTLRLIFRYGIQTLDGEDV